MPNENVIWFSNHSSNLGTIALFHKTEENANDSYNVVWLAKKCHPNTDAILSWETTWDLVWCQTGKLESNPKIRAFQVLPADPSDHYKNSATLTRQDGAYRFLTGKKEKEIEKLIIHTDSKLPNHDVSVGIGMGGFPSILTQGSPNSNYQFLPEAQYMACFGTFDQGQILNPNEIINPYLFNFPVNISWLYIELNEANQWSSSPMTNSQIIQAKEKLQKEGTK